MNDFEKDLGKLGDDASGIFEGLSDSIAAFDSKEKTKGIASGLLKTSSFAAKVAWGLGSMAVKNTPKVIVTVADTRRAIAEGLVEGYEGRKKEEKEKEFDDEFTKKIEQLKLKSQNDDE